MGIESGKENGVFRFRVASNGILQGPRSQLSAEGIAQHHKSPDDSLNKSIVATVDLAAAVEGISLGWSRDMQSRRQ